MASDALFCLFALSVLTQQHVAVPQENVHVSVSGCSVSVLWYFCSVPPCQYPVNQTVWWESWQTQSVKNAVVRKTATFMTISCPRVCGTCVPSGPIRSRAPVVLYRKRMIFRKLSSPILQEPSIRKTRSALAALQTGWREKKNCGEDKYNLRRETTEKTFFCLHLSWRSCWFLFCFPTRTRRYKEEKRDRGWIKIM